MTYIGNGPNFMVKAIAEGSGIRMPTFFGYMMYSIIILIPVFRFSVGGVLTARRAGLASFPPAGGVRRANPGRAGLEILRSGRDCARRVVWVVRFSGLLGGAPRATSPVTPFESVRVTDCSIMSKLERMVR